MNAMIKKVHAREVLDSRGNPTVEAEVTLESGVIGRAIVPSGASTGEHEALEMRDGDLARYMGKGVSKAVGHINGEISNHVVGSNAYPQNELDAALISLDGTPNKGRLGANALLGVSMAAARACSNSKVGVTGEETSGEFYHYLHAITGRDRPMTLPVPLMNIVNGGMHADNNLDIQEFMVAPIGASSFSQGLRMVVETYHNLKKVLTSKGLSTLVGDEGGFAPNLESNAQALELIIQAIESAGYEPGKDIYIALDCAASSFYKNGKYLIDGKAMNAMELTSYYEGLVGQYPLYSIEDGHDENDWDGWKHMTQKLGSRIQLVGDDLFVTNPKRLKKGIENGICNSILIKLNQIGTLTETIETMKLAEDSGYTNVVSHRSGETEDTTIADLSVGFPSGQIKSGAPARTDRVCKYNRLLRIEEMMGANATYAGKSVLRL